MKVIIDVSHLHQLALKRGIGFYMQNLYKALKTQKNGDKYFLKKSQKERFEADLIHYPYFDPFFLTLPLIKNKPIVVTIHDLIPLKFPNHYPRGLKGELKWQMQKQLVKRSNTIITDSLTSKKDIQKIIGYPANKIYPIYLAVGEEFQKLETENWKLKIKEKYHLPDIFLLYVGDLNWNKNVKGLIKAFSTINHQSSIIKLVLIGSAFENKQLPQLLQLEQLINKLNLQNEIIKLGFIPTNDLVVIYNLATLYIQPSFYEGFGLPVLEAMSCGCPVLSSNQGSLVEVGGEAVEYFNPYSENDLSTKLMKTVGNRELLNDLRTKGLIQAKKFTWGKTALGVKKVYEKVLV